MIDETKFYDATTYGSYADVAMVITTIITIIFIGITYNAQTKALKVQIEKNEIDFILSLFLQLDTELQNFTSNNRTEETDIVYSGGRALLHYSKNILNFSGGDKYKVFLNHFESDQVFYLIKSFDVIYNRLMTSQINSQDLLALKDKLTYYFNTNFETSLLNFSTAFINENDDKAIELRNFYNSYTMAAQMIYISRQQENEDMM